jgi:tetratricopeptide (TPR) repeat protein
LGFVYEKMGRYDQAISLYRQVIERHPHDSDGAISWNNMGNALNALNQPEKAIEAYQQAIEIDPTFTWPYHSLGTLYEQRGEAELALALYQQAVRRGKSKMTAYEGVGVSR